nr:uncharacterized protein LOC104102845 [Nicotiana tomentosiformis]
MKYRIYGFTPVSYTLEHGTWSVESPKISCSQLAESLYKLASLVIETRVFSVRSNSKIGILQACAKRIEGDESGHKHCTGQYFDYWQCIDKCVAVKLFDQLK